MAQLKKRDLSGKERVDLLNSLNEALQDWGTETYHEVSFDLWTIFDSSGHPPYEGGVMKWPTYLRRDFAHWYRLQRWHELNEDLPTTDGLPTIEDLQ